MLELLRLKQSLAHKLMVLLLFLGSFLKPDFVSAQNQVDYIGPPLLPPEIGVLLPEVPTTLDAIVYRDSLGATFTNSCYANGLSGEASVTVDASQRVIVLDFDQSTATPFPNCIAIFDPVSTIQLVLSPLSAGIWTLEVDWMLIAGAPLYSPVPAKTVEFEVIQAGAAVPSMEVFPLAVLLSTMVVSALLLRRNMIGK